MKIQVLLIALLSLPALAAEPPSEVKTPVQVVCESQSTPSMAALCTEMLTEYIKSIAGKSRVSGLCYALKELGQPTDADCSKADAVYQEVMK